MAACSIRGVPNIQVCKSDFTRTTSGHIHPCSVIRTWLRQKPQQFASLVQSRRSASPLIVSCGPPFEIQTNKHGDAKSEASNVEDALEEKKSTAMTSQLIPNSFEVQSLLSEICDTSSIAEFELKLDGFRLYVTRDLAQKSEPSPPPTSPPVSTKTTVETPDSNGSVSTTSLAISKSIHGFGQNQTFLDKATDEGLVILQSPRVGYFRRSRTIKGKRAPPSCKEKQIVKEGQVLCYIEQFGGEIPIESDVSGEITKILREDGEPVGYGDSLIAILPSFPGIKKLQ